MDPNNQNSNQQPQNQPSQPQQPQVIVGSTSPNNSPPKPLTQPDQPYMSQPTQQPMTDREMLGHKLKIFSSSLRLIVLAVALIMLIGLFILGKIIHSNTPNSPSSSSNSATQTGSSQAAGASTSKTACQLFTLSDAKGIMGSSATAASTLPPADLNGSNSIQTDCNYNGQGNTASIQFVVIVSNNASDASNAYSSQSESQAAPVSGVGDKASWDNNVGLTVQKGNTVVNVGTSDQNGNDSQSIDTQVANTILSNL